MKTCFYIFLLISLVACGKSPHVPLGISSLSEAQSIADDALLRASVDKLRQSLDVSNVSEEKIEQFNEFASGWSKAKLRSYHKWTKVFTPDEFKQFRAEEDKTKSQWLKDNELTRQWNYQPEAYFVYFFEDSDSKERFSITFTIGLVKRQNQWFFVFQS